MSSRRNLALLSQCSAAPLSLPAPPCLRCKLVCNLAKLQLPGSASRANLHAYPHTTYVVIRAGDDCNMGNGEGDSQARRETASEQPQIPLPDVHTPRRHVAPCAGRHTYI